eukprot:1159764-Pelagomonas_calceolata.AAC.10
MCILLDDKVTACEAHADNPLTPGGPAAKSKPYQSTQLSHSLWQRKEHLWRPWPRPSASLPLPLLLQHRFLPSTHAAIAAPALH